MSVVFTTKIIFPKPLRKITDVHHRNTAQSISNQIYNNTITNLKQASRLYTNLPIKPNKKRRHLPYEVSPLSYVSIVSCFFMPKSIRKNPLKNLGLLNNTTFKKNPSTNTLRPTTRGLLPKLQAQQLKI